MVFGISFKKFTRRNGKHTKSKKNMQKRLSITSTSLSCTTSQLPNSHSALPNKLTRSKLNTNSNAVPDRSGLHRSVSMPTRMWKSIRRSKIFFTRNKNEQPRTCENYTHKRDTPIKQGYLNKRSSKSLSKEWNMKYVILYNNGRMMYYPSLQEYVEDLNGKEILLQYTAVKVPGQLPRGTQSVTDITEEITLSSINEDSCLDLDNSVGADILLNNTSNCVNDSFRSETLNFKSRPRRMNSFLRRYEYDHGYQFFIVSLHHKEWQFKAQDIKERDCWVAAIEEQIMNSLQLMQNKNNLIDPLKVASVLSIRDYVPGNRFCVDCDAVDPGWASLNLGVLMCIECSGVHRNLGSHISKVRSLGLDEWPPSHVSVMLAIGNTLANSVWECQIQDNMKPIPTSRREEKEKWIRAKYKNKKFLAPLENSMSLGQQLVEAVFSSNIRSIIHILALSSSHHVNATVAPGDLRTPLHIACGIGNFAVAQLLIWHKADVKAADEEGRTCLDYARAAAARAGSKFQSTINLNDAPSTTWKSLEDLLISYGCPENSSAHNEATSRRRPYGVVPLFEMLPSVIV